MMNAKRKRLLIIVIILMFFTGAFFVGLGAAKVIENLRIRKNYRESSVVWKQELAAGEATDEVRDRRNQMLADNMKYVSIEQQLYFADGQAKADARISVDAQSEFGCTVTIIRDATGECLYQSDVVDPGHYIEQIKLSTSLKAGYYPCTAVWSYYTDQDEYVGETAWKLVIIVKD